MTKYILHGGATKLRTDDNKRYYQEMVRGLQNPKILLIYFARELDQYDESFKIDAEMFEWANPEVPYALTVATEEDFIEQARESDVLYFAGGTSYKLIEAIKKQDTDVKKLFEGKVISGSSAGANMVSEWFYGHGAREVGRGLGTLPITVFVHHRASEGQKFWVDDERTKEIEDELLLKSGRTEILRIPEQKFIVL